MASTVDAHSADLSRNLLDTLDKLAGGVHAGHRPAHAKGIMFSGVFRPSREAATLTRAPHAHRETTPVTVRFSDATGLPTIPDNDPAKSGPRGIAIRFHLAEHVHTDIIGHSTNGFPTRTAEEFLEFLRAAAASGPDAPKPTPIEKFVGAHPNALKFVTTPKPIPTSFAREAFFGVNAFKFTSQDGPSKYGRFRIRPEAGTEYLDAGGVAAKSANFLMDEIVERVARGPVKFQVVVQIAGSGDVVDDASVAWPDDRPQLDFGTITLNARVANDESEQRRIIFDPIPRVDGIESSGDPLLEPRAALYLASGRRRRKA